MVGKTYYIEYNHITLFVSKSSLATSTNRIKARALTMYIKLICNQWLSLFKMYIEATFIRVYIENRG